MPIGEFLTKNFVLMLRKIPSIRLQSPPVGEPNPPLLRRADPGANPEQFQIFLTFNFAEQLLSKQPLLSNNNVTQNDD